MLMLMARRKLKMIDAVVRVDELRVPPGNRLETLKGGRRGQDSAFLALKLDSGEMDARRQGS